MNSSHSHIAGAKGIPIKSNKKKSVKNEGKYKFFLRTEQQQHKK